MITFISGTNRPGNASLQIARMAAQFYNEKSLNTQVYSLCDLPRDVAFSEVYGERSPAFEKTIRAVVTDVDKFVFVLPEYNGGFPGILKLFLDAVEPHHWYGKKAALIGLSAGRSGNLRGLDHLTGVLNYLQVNVLHFKPNLSRIQQLPENGVQLPDAYSELLRLQAQLFAAF
ncbi:MAG: NADPH-dependent oxidoreductase [Cryomorphaceae bacterium]|nr:MAG: NADPH-dependent oxidoreductase [Cryomorphaceae bacterium]